ncbi:MAG: DUF5906 domain-containing protein [Magnetospirillum sp.]|nr:DUF5906 domain-containing protein [Magnetospirillum sp.]
MAKPIKLDDVRRARGRGARKTKGNAAVGDKDIEKRIEDLNQEYAMVLVGDKALILHQTFDFDGKPIVNFLTVSAFLAFLETERVTDGETDKITSIAVIWKKHPKRLSYQGVAFAPEGVPPKWFNLWRGFTVEPAPHYPDMRDHARKHFPTFHEHILKNVARGDANIARWVWGWFAHMIQRPTERIGVALVLRGLQGCGKSKPGDVVGSLIGPHHVLIDDPKHLVGSFNAHMLTCLMLQADEGFWAGDKTAEGKLKSLVTSSVHLIEKKGVDPVKVRNLIRLMVTSNNEWVVPAGFEERRFAVLDVGNGNLQDKTFFAKIDEEMDKGGREHLLTYLMRFDLSQVDLRTIPATEALFEQKMASMTEIQAWWLDRLRAGTLIPAHKAWLAEVAIEPFYDSYVRYAEKLGKARRLHKEQWGQALRKLLPKPIRDGQKINVQKYDAEGVPMHDHKGEPMTERKNGYKAFPALKECREHFEGLVRWKIAWDEESEAPAGENPPPAPSLPAGGEGGASARGGDEFDLATWET